MADEPIIPPSNGQIPTAPEPPAPEPRQSLREVAEAAYDQIEQATPDEGGEPSLDDGGRARDAQGRFAPKPSDVKPGEQPPEGPAPTEQPDQNATPAHPASSNEPPQHWSAEDRRMFSELPPDGQAFLMRRYSEMEADYTRKTQANATAVQFTQSLEPIFTEPAIASSLQNLGLSAHDAIAQWADLHRRGNSPNVQDKIGMMVEIAENIGLNPAALFVGSNQPQAQANALPAGLPPEVASDPAIKFFADHLGRTASDVQALKSQITRMQDQAVQAANAEALKVTRWGIDSFAEEKDAQGNLLRPDFDEQLPFILELYKANPQRDLREAYDTARRMNPKSFQLQLDAAVRTEQQKRANEKAKLANRGNVRGITSPVSKPQPTDGKQSLRDVLEQSADEVGLT